jgi:hypothetical protein
VPARLAVTVVYGLLVLEAASTGLWIARLLPSLGVRGRTVVALVALRAVVSSLQIVSAAMLRTRRPSGPPFARVALIASAGLIPFEVGWRLVPSNLDPTYGWWIVFGYWVYVVIGVIVLRD